MHKRLLFADDSLTMHRVVEITFAREALTLVTAYSGAEALKAAAATPPDVALIDMDMADMDGYTLCAKLLAQHPTSPMPVLLLGSDQHPVDAARAEAAGAVGMVKKPFDTQSLVKRVREAIMQEAGAPAPTLQATPPPLPERAPFFQAPPLPPEVPAQAATTMPPPLPVAPQGDGWQVAQGGPPNGPKREVTLTPPLPAAAELPELPTWDMSIASDPPEAARPTPPTEPLWNERESTTAEDLQAPPPEVLQAAMRAPTAAPKPEPMLRDDTPPLAQGLKAPPPTGLAEATLGAGTAQAALRDALASALPAHSPDAQAMAEALTPWLMQTVERVLWDVVPPIAQAQVRDFLDKHPPQK